MAQRKRILFMAESVTLAHLARPYALARQLDPAEYEIIFACADNYLQLFPEWPWQRERIHSITPQAFMDRLARGARVYTLEELKQYAKEDLQLLDQVRPDVIVGDFRLSLSASARVAGIPYIALTNAYWSPYASIRHFPVPNLPMTRFVGLPLASALFSLARPFAFRWHALPVNLLRRSYGLKSLGLDLRRVYTDADITLYADVPELVPTSDLPANHRYIGPVEWSPAIPMPALPAADPNRPFIYVTLGSSGSVKILPLILEALSQIDCYVAVATAGAKLEAIPANVTVADYLPGAEMCARANLVICNGGSPTSQQAIARGVPILGIPFNLDQHLNMQCVSRSGAGISLRHERLSDFTLLTATKRLLNNHEYTYRAESLGNRFNSYSSREFRIALETACQSHPQPFRQIYE